MTTFAPAPTTSASTTHPTVSDAILTDIREHAAALDHGTEPARRSFPALAGAGVLGLGAPRNAGGGLPAMAQAIQDIARECVSTAFSVWANRMTIEYLAAARTPFGDAWAQRLREGEQLGITGMASAFKDVAGCGSVDLHATRVDGGYRISGSLRWASNLYDDSLLVSAARTGDGHKFVFATPVSAEGITIGRAFSLLALDSTESSFVTIDEAFVPDEQVLSHDFDAFLTSVRPTFVVLQTALCVGLAATCLEQAREGLVGVNAVFTADVDTAGGRHALIETTLRRLAASVAGDDAPTRKELLSMRLAAAEIAVEAANLEIRTAGGKGYASSTPTSRRYREATFLPVQSPSEGQLRWELSQCA